jgi:hypothetical protein
MATLYVRSTANSAIDGTLTLTVRATPDRSGNLHGGLYDFCYSHRTVNTKAGESMTILLDDQTVLKLVIVDYLTTAPGAISITLPPENATSALLRINDLIDKQLVFFSIVLQSTNQNPPITLFCDPQVGNDPKVSPT